jgi:transposase-like protein
MPTSESEDEEELNIKSKILRSYTIKFKLEAIGFAQKHSIKSAARKFNVDRKRIREWITNKDRFKNQRYLMKYNFNFQRLVHP